MDPCFRCTAAAATLLLLHCLDVTQKAAESNLLNCVTDPVALGICMIYRNLFLLECALALRVETNDLQQFCSQEVVPIQKYFILSEHANCRSGSSIGSINFQTCLV